MITSTRQLTRFALRPLVAIVVIATALVVVATPTAASASSVAGPISRAEILQRAQYWVDQAVVYGTSFDSAGNVVSTRTAPDSDGKSYRTDCSGLLAMAWHLANSPTTADFAAGDSRWTTLSGANAMMPGDAMVTGSDHTEMFAGWVSDTDHTQGAWVYSLNGPVDHDWAKGPQANSHGQVGRRSWAYVTGFQKFISYANVVDDVARGPLAMYHGQPDVFAIGADAHLYGYAFSGAAWSPRGSIDTGMSTTAVPTTVYYKGVLHLFTITTNGNLYHYYFNGTAWVGPENLGGGLSSHASPVANVDHDNLEVYTVSVNGHLYEDYFTTSWSGETDIGAGANFSTTSSLTVMMYNNWPQVFAITTGGNLYTMSFSGTAWMGPYNLGGGFSPTSSPAVSIDFGNLDVYTIGVNGHLYETYFTGAWNLPIDTGTGTTYAAGASPTVITVNGAPQVFAVTTNGHVNTTTFAGGWQTPADAGAGYATTTRLASDLDHGNLEVYGLGGSGQLIESWRDGSGWHGPATIDSGLASL